MELCRKYPERISYVHIKAMDPISWSSRPTTRTGRSSRPSTPACSVAPPEGEPDMACLIEALADLDKELYVICEQDMYGCDPSYPLPNAIKTREYLASCGLGLK
jgi:inosose dehydratase